MTTPLSTFLTHLRLAIQQVLAPRRHANLADYWHKRAETYGRRSVLNLIHENASFDAITQLQKDLLFPLFISELTGGETTVLDFGCGPGRFTDSLAELIGGTAVGVDITPNLIALAPPSERVRYMCITSARLPFPDSSFDIIWSCLVLGAIPDCDLQEHLSEIDRVLKPKGLFFFVENTAVEKSTGYWFFREEKTYIDLAGFCRPAVLSRYYDASQRISVFSGRKA